ncbi:MAG TPA: TonB family protein [Thermoanaerobaculia bacterium]|jgi:TonB family protein|nr:TonB family protein [Thermoanaerobaculia bacterium]
MRDLGPLLAVLLVAGGAVATPLAAADQDHGPLPLRSPLLRVPEETAGSGLAPEAAVRITIDEKGRVSGVEVVSITPTSELDPFFRRELVETIAAWRFAPAIKDGEPVRSTLDWRVQFPATPVTLEALMVSGALPGMDAEQRRSSVLAIHARQRAALLEAQARIARDLLDAGHAYDAFSPRFVVHCDADDRHVGAAVAKNLEVAFNVLGSELLAGIVQQPAPSKLEVFVYRNHQELQALLASMPAYEATRGLYSPAGLIAFDLDQASSEAALSVLFHLATHAFLDRHMVRPGVALPRWLAEGFADYVGNSRIKDGRLQPGKIRRSTFRLVGGVPTMVDTASGQELEEAKKALRQGEGVGVRAMLASSPQLFYGEKQKLYYASSWLLVHYLRDGDERWASERFPTLLLYLAEGYPQLAAFRSVYGDPATADEAFQRYVKAF